MASSKEKRGITTKPDLPFADLPPMKHETTLDAASDCLIPIGVTDMKLV